MKNFFGQKNKGFTLVETLVAISIFTMSILGLMSVLTQGISDTGYAKRKIAATYLAQEGIEYVRNKRDTSVLYSGDAQTSWDNFIDSNQTPIGSITPPAPSDTSFSRTILMTPGPGNPDEVIISSTVTWTQGSGDHNITFSESLFNWIQ